MLLLATALASPAFLDDGFVLAAPSTGPFSGGLNAPTVDYDVANGVYHMYFESPAADVPGDCQSYYTIGHATSSDGVLWDLEENPVLTPDPNPESPYHCVVSQPAVVYDGGTFHLFFSMAQEPLGEGQSNDGTGVGYATSTDGVNFTVEAAPLVDDEGETMGLPSAAIVNDVLYLIYVWKPDFRMAYLPLNGVSEWTFLPDPVVDHDDVGVWAIQWVLGPSLFCEDDQPDPFTLVYAGDDNTVGTPVRSLAYATSGDGLNWGYPEDNPLTTGDLDYPNLNHWDALGAGLDYVMWYSMTDPKTGMKAIGHAATTYDVGRAQPRLCPHPDVPGDTATDTAPTDSGGTDNGIGENTEGETKDKAGDCSCASGRGGVGVAGLLLGMMLARRK